MSNELHVSAHIDAFKAFPSTCYAITLANAPHRLGPPDRSDKPRSVVVAEELTPNEIGDLRLLTSELGRVVLLFTSWQVFNRTHRALKSPAA